ncbi:MAG: hypothetical protein QM526_01645 [Alphaproteobacteria bacterium]|nr:hypothetical protein [Alphaproteobacteria bacterium]
MQIAFVIHIVALIIVIITIIRADIYMAAWVTKRTIVLSHLTIKKIHEITSWLLIIMILSGATMVWNISPLYFFLNPLFLLKMFFVLCLIINSFVIGRLMRIVTEKTFARTTKQERMSLFISGGVSVLSWVSTIFLAFFIS